MSWLCFLLLHHCSKMETQYTTTLHEMGTVDFFFQSDVLCLPQVVKRMNKHHRSQCRGSGSDDKQNTWTFFFFYSRHTVKTHQENRSVTEYVNYGCIPFRWVRPCWFNEGALKCRGAIVTVIKYICAFFQNWFEMSAAKQITHCLQVNTCGGVV